VILDDQHTHSDIVEHNTSQRHNSAAWNALRRVATAVLHWCDQPPDTTWTMSRITSRLPMFAATITVAAAVAACGSSSSISTNSGATHLTDAQAQQAVVSFAQCIRSHGVPSFPDPSSPKDFKVSLSSNVAQSPAFQSARASCQHLLPGSGQPTQSPPPSRAQISAELAFARCLRSHGFPNFPDPTSTGELSHEMLAAAGIDVHQPAAVQAADACVSVTHGFLTKAAVARFVAGH
jgi:hypothetical protein